MITTTNYRKRSWRGPYIQHKHPRVFPSYYMLPNSSKETNPAVKAVIHNDLSKLKEMIESGETSPNVTNRKGLTLLAVSIINKRWDVLEYLLSLDNIEVNYVDKERKIPLLVRSPEFPAFFLIPTIIVHKNIDINVQDEDGDTFFHIFGKNLSGVPTEAIIDFIEKTNPDLNIQNRSGKTPLHIACESGLFFWMCILLYYGANPTIVSKSGLLPLAAIPSDFNRPTTLMWSEILYNYQSDEKIIIELPTLIKVLAYSYKFFPEFLKCVDDIDIDLIHIPFFQKSFPLVRPYNLKLFIRNFPDEAKLIFNEFSALGRLIVSKRCSAIKKKKIIDVFLGSCDELATIFVQRSKRFPPRFKISRIMTCYENEISLEDTIGQIMALVSYGLAVTSKDLDFIYDKYGYCELFKFLLHVDIALLSLKSYLGYTVHAMGTLYYCPNTGLERLLPRPSISSYERCLDYYNNQMLKRLCLMKGDPSTALKIKSMPDVPLLQELSRNAARRYIVKTYRVRACSRFYSIVKALPITECHKKILTMETKLY